MRTAAAPTPSAPGSRRNAAAHRSSDRTGRRAAGPDVCSDGFLAMSCPYCCGPESD